MRVVVVFFFAEVEPEILLKCKVLIVQCGPDYCLVVCRGPAVETEMTHKDYDMSELKKLLKSFSVVIFCICLCY